MFQRTCGSLLTVSSGFHLAVILKHRNFINFNEGLKFTFDGAPVIKSQIIYEVLYTDQSKLNPKAFILIVQNPVN